MNFSKWSNEQFEKLLDTAQNELDPVKKIKILSAAEQLLIEESPVCSLFYERENNKKNPSLHKVSYLKNTGCVDFKYAFIKKQN